MDQTAFAHLYPYEPNFITSHGLQYHYVDQGRGEPILMVHGNPTWSFYFRSQIDALSNQYRVIVPDHMGCGLSDNPTASQYDYNLQSRVDDLSNLMHHINLKQPITLLLHDWGGMIGLAWAMDHLEKIGRIIITNTAGFFPPKDKTIPLRLRLIRTAHPIMDWMVLRLNLFSRAALYMAPKKPLSPAVQAGLTAPYDAPHRRLATLKFVQDIPLSPDDPSGPIVARVEAKLEKMKNIPSLLLWGAHDFVFDKDYFDEWRRRWPQAEWHWFDDAGHYLFEDIPDKIADTIKAFLRKHPVK